MNSKFAIHAVLLCATFLIFTATGNAQCGVTYGCVTSFSISPSEIVGDLAHGAVATIMAMGPGTSDWFVYLNSGSLPKFVCNNGTPDFAGPYPACHVTRPTATITFYGYNGGGAPTTVPIHVQGDPDNDHGITQYLTIDAIPDPSEPPPQDPDGPCPDCGDAGNPINVTNGNTWIPQQDYFMPGVAGGFTLARTWNSMWSLKQGPEEIGIFGDSWRSSYEERIQGLTGGVVNYWKANGSFLSYTYNSLSSTYTLTAPANDQTMLSFSSTTNLWTITEKNGTQRIFNNAGYLTSIVDRNGNTVTINVDANNQNRISSITDASGHVLTLNYSNTSYPRLCTSISDSVGTFATYNYDFATGRLLQVQYPDGSQYNFQYNDSHSSTLISLITDLMGKTVEAHTYDSQRRGRTSQQANDSNGKAVNLVTMSYGYPNAWQNYVCNSTNQICVAVTVANVAQRHFLVQTSTNGGTCATCGFQGNSQTTISPKGDSTSHTDGNFNATQYTYDGQDNILTKSLPVGNPFTGFTGTDTWSYTYDGFGNVLTVTDPLGENGAPNHTTVYGYDSHGNLTSITTPSPDGTTPASVTTFTPNARGQVTQIVDPLLNKTTITYCTTNQTNCPFGLIYYIKDSQNHKTTYSYDGRGNRLSVTNALNKVTQFQYDAMNRVTLITYPTSPATTVQFHYDWRGRRDYVIDQNGNKTTYGYDDADRLVSVTDAQPPTPGVTAYTYDTENNLTDIYDAAANHTHIDYVNNNPFKTTFPSGYFESYQFDGNDQMTVKTDRSGNRLYYYHDYQNRVMRRSYPDLGEYINYIYDPAGRMTQVQDFRSGPPYPLYTFTYDNMNRLTSATTNYGFTGFGNMTVNYGYDAASNRTSMTDPQNLPTAYTYDALNRLSTLAFNGQTPAFGFGYDALSRRTSLTRPNGVNTTYAYDPISRLTSILHKLGTATIDGATYTYDSAGNRKTRTDKRLNTTLTYGYDNIYQLLSAKQGSATKETYTYDLVGNRLSSLGVSPYSYNSSNELTALPSGSYSYDNNGNTKTKPDGTQYTWDIENELTQVVLPGTGGTVNFKYDPFGRRIQKSSPQNGTTTTTNYVYDGRNLLEELDVSGNVLARYTQGQNVDEPMTQLRIGATSYYHQDGLGSVTSLSNSTGSLANTYSYDSFGRLTASTGTVTNPLWYTGREFDSGTGLYFYRARYLDSTTGRFLSEDPLGFWAADNFYPYVHNSPATYLDPLGWEKEKKPWYDNLDWIPGVSWVKCKTWGYYCLKTVREKRLEELAHSSTGTYTNDELANPQDEGARLIKRCAGNDNNCKRWLNECGDDILGPLNDGMFPK
jgi:RHS repeat-associated protein